MYSPRTLRSDLKHGHRLPVREVLQLGVQLAGALGHLHQHGLVHRDVKPSNVIFLKGRPCLADIGLVAGIDEARSFVGTEGFIAPEGPGTPQADLFALGNLLYEAATGRDRCDFPSLPDDLGEGPEHEAALELNEVLARACAPDCKRRHANAAELAGDLNQLLAGRSMRRAYSIERRLCHVCRAALAAAAVSVLAVEGGMWFQENRRAEAGRRAAHEQGLRQRAERAEAEAATALRRSLLEQSRVLIQSRAPDRRSAALALLGQAAAIAPGADLRTAAAAALATPERREVHSWVVGGTDPVGPPLNAAGDTYLRGNNQGILTFHRVSDDSLVRTLTNGTRRVENALFSPDGRWLVAADKEPTLRLWDLEAGQLASVAPGTIRDLSSDGTRLLRYHAGRGAVLEFDEAFQPRQLPAHRRGLSPSHLAFSPDGHWLVSGGEDGAWLGEAKERTPVARLTREPSEGVGFAVNAGAVLCAGARRWEAFELPPAKVGSAVKPASTEALNRVPARRPEAAEFQFKSLALPWAAVQRLLWAGAIEPRSGHWVSFEEPAQGRGTVMRTGWVGSQSAEEFFFETKSGGNASVSPDGRWAARGNWKANDVWVIDLTGRLPAHRIEHAGDTATAFSPDSKEVVVCGEAEYRFVRLGTWRERLVVWRESPDDRPGRVAFAHRAGRVALLASRSRIRLIWTEDGREEMTLSTHEGRLFHALAFSPDDRYLAAASPNQRLVIWDLEALQRRLANLGLRESSE